MRLLCLVRPSLALLALSVGVACNKPDHSPAGGAGGAATQAGASGQVTQPPAWVLSEQMDRLDELRTDCKVSADTKSLAGCEAFDALKDDLLEGGAPLTQLFPAVAYALSSPIPELKMVATEVLAEGYQELNNVQGKQLSSPAVESLLSSFLKTEGAAARRIARPVALIATLARQETALHAAIKQHSDGEARQSAYRALLQYGSALSLKRVQEVAVAENEMDALAAVSAIAGVGSFRFRELGGEVCPWVEKLAKRDSAVLQQQAVKLWMECQGPHIDSAVDLVKTNAESRDAGGFFTALGDWCKPPGDHARCGEVKTLLLNAWNNKKLDDDIRLSALRSLSAQWFDEPVKLALNEATKSSTPQIRIAGETALKAQNPEKPAAKTTPVSASKEQ